MVRGIKDLGPNRGATGSHNIVCDDGKTYVVKFAGKTRVAVNEFLGQALAKVIGLPVPNASLLEVDSELIGTSSDLRYRGVAPGVHIGSELVLDSFSLDELMRDPTKSRLRLQNPGALTGSICHDNWVLTVDRERGDNHLFQNVEGGIRYLMVDFTHAFTGPNWTLDGLEQASYLRSLVPVHPHVAREVTGMNSFSPTLERIEALEDSEIEAVVAAIPPSWGVSEDERDCLVDFMGRRRGLLRGVLSASGQSFPNWTT